MTQNKKLAILKFFLVIALIVSNYSNLLAQNIHPSIKTNIDFSLNFENEIPWNSMDFSSQNLTKASFPPTVSTNAATSVTLTGATLNGTVNANGYLSTVVFFYGTTASYGSTVSANPASVDGTSDNPVSITLTGLSPNTTYHFKVTASSTEGATDGVDMTFTTAAVAPTVTTQAVTGIGNTIATGNGNITDLGDPNPSAYGVCWSTSENPTTDDPHTDEGEATSTGAFTSDITGLTAYTTYYVRAYATNSTGTSYGDQVSFKTNPSLSTATTQDPTDIGATIATGNGNITALGYPLPTAHGVCWNTTGNPLVSDSHTDEGAVSETGAFTSQMTNLTPNTTYYYRAYVISLAGTTYGFPLTFTTSSEEAPKVTTQDVSDITTTTATGNGNITLIGVPETNAYGVCWNTTGDPTIDDNYTDEGATSSTGAFTSNITNLEPYTTYYVKAFAANDVDTAYGEEVSFTTDAIISTVTTESVTNITLTSATGNGNITVLGIPAPTSYGVCWNTSGTPTIEDQYTNEGQANNTGTFSSDITDLTLNTKYYVRAYVANDIDTAYGEEVSFTTLATSLSENDIIKLNVYPNPVNSILNIALNDNLNTTNCKIFIYDMNGKIIHEQQVFQNNEKIDVSNYNPGTYIIEIKSDLYNEHQTIIIR